MTQFHGHAPLPGTDRRNTDVSDPSPPLDIGVGMLIAHRPHFRDRTTPVCKQSSLNLRSRGGRTRPTRAAEKALESHPFFVSNPRADLADKRRPSVLEMPRRGNVKHRSKMRVGLHRRSSLTVAVLLLLPRVNLQIQPDGQFPPFEHDVGRDLPHGA
jgi:hypothetical protein